MNPPSTKWGSLGCIPMWLAPVYLGAILHVIIMEPLEKACEGCVSTGANQWQLRLYDLGWVCPTAQGVCGGEWSRVGNFNLKCCTAAHECHGGVACMFGVLPKAGTYSKEKCIVKVPKRALCCSTTRKRSPEIMRFKLRKHWAAAHIHLECSLWCYSLLGTTREMCHVHHVALHTSQVSSVVLADLWEAVNRAADLMYFHLLEVQVFFSFCPEKSVWQEEDENLGYMSKITSVRGFKFCFLKMRPSD